MEQNKDYFFTSDLCLAAILRTKGWPVKGYEQMWAANGTKRIKFFFEKNDEVLNLFAQYALGEGDTAIYKKFNNHIKELKNIIFINSGVDKLF